MKRCAALYDSDDEHDPKEKLVKTGSNESLGQSRYGQPRTNWAILMNEDIHFQAVSASRSPPGQAPTRLDFCIFLAILGSVVAFFVYFSKIGSISRIFKSNIKI